MIRTPLAETQMNRLATIVIILGAAFPCFAGKPQKWEQVPKPVQETVTRCVTVVGARPARRRPARAAAIARGGASCS